MSKPKKILVEIADTPSRRERGLMYRKTLANNHGMLFKFPRAEPLAFWMQNTYIPLDIAFLDDSGKIMQIESMSPLSTRQVIAKNSCRYALEVNRDWFAKNSVKIGDRIANLGISSSRRYAQATPPSEVPLLPDEAQQMGVPQDNQNAQQQPQQQAAPSAVLDMSIRAKFDYADTHSLPVVIVYTTEEGNTLPPRKLTPIPHKGYPIESGPNGYRVQAIDASPTIGGHMTIEGGHEKSFLLDNIISLEVETPKTPQQGNMPVAKKEKDVINPAGK